MKQKRFDAGAISLDSDEVKFVLDEEGNPVDVKKKARKDAHKMIEEYMLLANRLVAEELSRGVDIKKPVAHPMLYRVHDKPTDERITSLEEFLNGLGHDVAIKNDSQVGITLSNLLDTIKDPAMRDTVQGAIVRSIVLSAPKKNANENVINKISPPKNPKINIPSSEIVINSLNKLY